MSTKEFFLSQDKERAAARTRTQAQGTILSLEPTGTPENTQTRIHYQDQTHTYNLVFQGAVPLTWIGRYFFLTQYHTFDQALESQYLATYPTPESREELSFRAGER